MSKRVVSILECRYNPESNDLALAYQNLAMLYLHEEQYSEAKEYLNKAMVVWERTVSPDSPLRISGMNMALLLALRERRFDEAISYSLRLLSLASARLGADHPELAAVLNNAGAAYAGAGQHSKAAELLAQAVEIYSSLVQKHHIDPQEPQYQQVLHNYAEALKKAHRKTEARKIEAQARNLVKGQHTIGVADSQR